MSDLPNGFTGFSHRDPGFESASDAIRKAEQSRAASGQHPHAASGHAAWQSNLARTTVAEQAASMWGAGGGTRGIAKFLRAPEEGESDSAPHFDPDKLAGISEKERHWAWIEIDLSAIRRNTLAIKRMLPRGVRIMAVVKADAYGHGAVQCARTALNSGAEYLGVATVDEAIKLREALINAPILVLSEPPLTSVPLLLAYKIMPSVYTAEFAVQYAEAADALGLKAPYHLAVNTGMNRIGVHHDEVVSFMRQIGFHRALELVGTFTHFATADCPESFDFQMQARRFAESINAMRAAGVDPGIVHAANSAAIVRYPEVHLDMVRLGIALYGFYPCPETNGAIDLSPVMSIHARITDTKLVPMGEGVSYGLHYRSPGSVKICTVPIGYADGLRRGLSGNTDFIVDGKAFHQVGNICMDQCMFEVDLRTYAMQRRVDPQIGDEVIIVGAQGDASSSIDQMAEKLGTIPHEIAIGFGCSRLPRVYR